MDIIPFYYVINFVYQFLPNLQETLIEFHIKLKVLICPNSLSSPFSLIPFQLADNHCFVSLVLINIKIILLHLCHCMTLSRAFYPCTGIYMFVPSLSLLVILKTFSNCYFTYFDSIQALSKILLSFYLDTIYLPLQVL